MMAGFAFYPQSYEEGTSREWLLANGLGGYASSTAVGANTRAYHGLLVAALAPPADRWLLLSSLDEEIEGASLANHQYPCAIYPQGFKYLQEFRLDPIPRFCYRIGGARVEKTVFMIRGENTTIISYKIKNGQGTFAIVPLVHCRCFHAASPLPGMRQETLGAGTILRSSLRPDIRLTLLSDGPAYVPQEMIYNSFEYEEERRRGLAWKEDLFSPGRFEIELSGDAAFAIAASTWRTAMPDWRAEQKKEPARLESLKAPLPYLARAADAFLVKRGQGKSLIAGYHWFDDWGRDAMISLPGLLLCTGRFEDARQVLKSFAVAMNDGVLPNDLGTGSYNTVDASLWFVRAVGSYFEYSKDLQFVGQLWQSLLEVFRRYSRPGEDFGGAEDGLIVSGPALTWMDARLDGRPVSPRAGKCCEINALWYSALIDMQKLFVALDKSLDPGFIELAERVKQSYQRFWNSENGCLYDVIDQEDASIRPNQIIAAGIPDLLPMVMRKSILDVVTRELLTPFGLRTLSSRDPRYEGRYEGDPRRRDGAYHQGTVWPWLMGPYIDALLSVKGRSGPVLAQARELLRPLITVHAGGINTLPEVFDGDCPQRPGGCISQAWSVAEVLRAWDSVQK
ncbi:MAG: glycogen debranching enzyme N-terminal domain-containing protein [Methanothrix sp.]|jgi:predicted glycogen debranching enzyme|nr:glycogen debranching enzyme N-terminal domain-containing protein [Methanothrix sp.]